MTGIYKITNKINGMCYIGQSIDIEQRWRRHKNYPLKYSKYPLYQAFEQFGIENFVFEVLEECKIQELDEKEKEYIKKFNSFNAGYNQTQGGSGNKGNVIKISLDTLYEIYELLISSNMSQREIAKLYQIGEDTVSEINHGKTRQLEGYTFPLRTNRPKKKYLCPKCGKEISAKALQCSECCKIASRKVKRPERDELKVKIKEQNFLELSRYYGVSDNAIRKWCINYNLPYKKTDIKKLTDEEWEKI